MLDDTEMTDDQREAVDGILAWVRRVAASDEPADTVNGRQRADEPLSAWGRFLGERSALLDADRGMGKTSVLLTVVQKLRDGESARRRGASKVLVVGPPVDARSLDRTDRVLLTLLQRFGSATVPSIAQAQRTSEDRPDAPERDEKARCVRDLLRLALRTHDLYSKFASASAVHEAELFEMLIRQSAGADEFRASFAQALRLLAPDTTVVFLLDDLDLSSGRAYEAIVDLDRYLAVPGAAFIFAARGETLESEIAESMMDGIRARSTELWQSEARWFLDKYLPRESRFQLDNWLPEARWRARPSRDADESLATVFGSRSPTLKRLLEEPTTVSDGVPWRLALLPGAPRDLGSLLRVVRAGEKDRRSKVGRRAEDLRLLAALADVAGPVWAQRKIREWRSAIGIVRFGNQSVDGSLGRWVVAEAHSRAGTLSPESPDPLSAITPSGGLSSLAGLSEGRLDAAWVELLIDYAMRVAPSLRWGVWDRFGAVIGSAETLVPFEKDRTGEPWRQQLASAGADRFLEVLAASCVEGVDGRSMVRPWNLIRRLDTGEDRSFLPTTVRRTIVYYRSLQDELRRLDAMPAGTRELRHVVNRVLVAHSRAVLEAYGARSKDRTQRMIVPPLGAFLGLLDGTTNDLPRELVALLRQPWVRVFVDESTLPLVDGLARGEGFEL